MIMISFKEITSGICVLCLVKSQMIGDRLKDY